MTISKIKENKMNLIFSLIKGDREKIVKITCLDSRKDFERSLELIKDAVQIDGYFKREEIDPNNRKHNEKCSVTPCGPCSNFPKEAKKHMKENEYDHS